MSDPKRLVEGNDLGAELLRSAKTDCPETDARRKTVLALGLASGTAVTGAASTTAAAGAVAAKGIAAATLAKVLAVAIVVGGVSAGVLVTTSDKRGESPAPSHPAAPMPRNAPSILVPTAPMPTTSAETPPPPATTMAPKTSPPVRVDRQPAPAASLGEELGALDVARAKLQSGNPEGALAALDDHDRRFPGGALRPEADVLRIEALIAAGKTTEARTRARAFLTRNPQAPQADHVRTLLAQVEAMQ